MPGQPGPAARAMALIDACAGTAELRSAHAASRMRSCVVFDHRLSIQVVVCQAPRQQGGDHGRREHLTALRVRPRRHAHGARLGRPSPPRRRRHRRAALGDHGSHRRDRGPATSHPPSSTSSTSAPATSVSWAARLLISVASPRSLAATAARRSGFRSASSPPKQTLRERGSRPCASSRPWPSPLAAFGPLTGVWGVATHRDAVDSPGPLRNCSSGRRSASPPQAFPSSSSRSRSAEAGDSHSGRLPDRRLGFAHGPQQCPRTRAPEPASRRCDARGRSAGRPQLPRASPKITASARGQVSRMTDARSQEAVRCPNLIMFPSPSRTANSRRPHG